MIRSLLGVALVLLLCLSLVAMLEARAILQVLMDSTRYATGYTETGFDSITIGMTEADVVNVLGKPLTTHAGNPSIVRWYGPPGSTVGEDSGLHVPPNADQSRSDIISFDLKSDRVIEGGTYAGQSPDEVRATLGQPIQEKIERSVIYWQYTDSPTSGNYHRRWIGFDPEGRVAEIRSYYYWD